MEKCLNEEPLDIQNEFIRAIMFAPINQTVLPTEMIAHINEVLAKPISGFLMWGPRIVLYYFFREIRRHSRDLWLSQKLDEDGFGW